MGKIFKTLIILSLITTINTLNAYGLESKNTTNEETIKNIYNLKIKQKSINEQISKIDKVIESKMSYTNDIKDTEVVQLSFVDDNSLKDNNQIKKTLEDEIQELKNLKNQLKININDLNEQ